ncbi:MAG: hypothetical protein E7001_02710 [Coriobacteriaceae bacterium]|nr:hypothetical protein [Coriobacteriaceae bacterium]
MASAPYPTDLYNRPGASGLRARIARGPLVVQGPLEAEFAALPGSEGIPATFWNAAEPQVVEGVHALAAAAGAELLITNTLRATAPHLAQDGVRQSPQEVNRAALAAARCAPGTFSLGAVGPCGIDAEIEEPEQLRTVRAAYRDQVHQLLVAGADGILLGDFGAIREIDPALEGASVVLDGMPLAIRFTVDADGRLPGDGLTIEEAVRHAQLRGAELVGAACPDFKQGLKLVKRMRSVTDLPLIICGGCPGEPRRGDDGLLFWDESPQELAEHAASWLTAGATAVGGGPGTTTRTTAALSALIALG